MFKKKSTIVLLSFTTYTNSLPYVFDCINGLPMFSSQDCFKSGFESGSNGILVQNLKPNPPKMEFFYQIVINLTIKNFYSLVLSGLRTIKE